MREFKENAMFEYVFRSLSSSKDPIKFLDTVITEFGFDVNTRGENFYDTLLYQSFKYDKSLKVAKYLVSKGACVNASLGGYPTNADSHGFMSILDAAGGFTPEIRSFLESHGAVSFEKLSEEDRKQKIANLDMTRQADKNKSIYRANEQLDLIVNQLPEEMKEEIASFIKGSSFVVRGHESI